VGAEDVGDRDGQAVEGLRVVGVCVGIAVVGLQDGPAVFGEHEEGE